jgi:hypothetical protein
MYNIGNTLLQRHMFYFVVTKCLLTNKFNKTPGRKYSLWMIGVNEFDAEEGKRKKNGHRAGGGGGPKLK